MGIRYARCVTLLIGVIVSLGGWADEPLQTVPEQFRGFDAASTYRILYNDVDGLLSAAVVDVGRSTREKAEPQQAKTGTRMKVNVKRATINEGNRFMYEAFEDEEQNQQFLKQLRASLEAIPDLVTLEVFNRDEQLAYWLNLYNITLLDELVAIYPKRDLKKTITGKKSILAKKLLTVGEVPLSLNDIQFTILRQNYENNPLIIYGLHQGIIGGPNIRKKAYKGTTVWRQLEDNAVEFINSNRGTYSDSPTVFKVSSLYDRNSVFFQDFESDLRFHLLGYLEGPERQELQSATKIRANINDWTITDLYGSYREIGGSFADNNAALLDSVQSVSPTAFGGGVYSSNFSAASGPVQSRARQPGRFSPQLEAYLTEIALKAETNYLDRGRVTVEELGEVSQQADQQEGQQDEQEGSQEDSQE